MRRSTSCTAASAPEGGQERRELGQADRVPDADATGPEHLGVDPGAGFRIERVQRLDPVVTSENPQRVGIAGEGAVDQGRHGAPGGTGDHAEHEVVAYPQDPLEPVVLGEARGGSADDDVGPVAFQVGLAVRAQFGDPVEIGRASCRERVYSNV